VSPTAIDSFRYAFRPELVVLYATILAGRWVMAFSQDGLLIVPRGILRMLVTFPVYILGVALIFGGMVGILHNVLSDVA
jgi:hypothetical protein